MDFRSFGNLARSPFRSDTDPSGSHMWPPYVKGADPLRDNIPRPSDRAEMVNFKSESPDTRRHGTKVGPVGAHPSVLTEGALLERWRAQFWTTTSLYTIVSPSRELRLSRAVTTSHNSRTVLARWACAAVVRSIISRPALCRAGWEDPSGALAFSCLLAAP